MAHTPVTTPDRYTHLGIPRERWRIRVFISSDLQHPFFEEGGFFTPDSAARGLALRMLLWRTPDMEEPPFLDYAVTSDVYLVVHIIKEAPGHDG